MQKRPFFRAAMAGFGKYSTGGYGWIGVYRVNTEQGKFRIRYKALSRHNYYNHYSSNQNSKIYRIEYDAFLRLTLSISITDYFLA